MDEAVKQLFADSDSVGEKLTLEDDVLAIMKVMSVE